MKHIHRKTQKFLRRWRGYIYGRVLDLGEPNTLSGLFGFSVRNTYPGYDLNTGKGRAHVADLISKFHISTITAFEILEHLSNGNQLLREIPVGTILICSIPTKHPIGIHWNESDPYDCHIFEQTPQQFDKYLRDAGWQIIDSHHVAILSKRIYSWFYYALAKRYYFVLARKVEVGK